MARRSGRFGRRRGGGSNLTAVIAQLYREQRAAEDRTMFDAYQNGGLIDGKPVNDARMRAYVAGRRDGFSKDDPLYDEWNNRLIQLDFRIGEEKVTLAFQQGKASAGAVASYYRSQLSKIPQDSAFYREVAGRAAQWAKSAAGAARSASRARLTKALEGKQKGVQQTWADFAALEGYLTDAAKRAGLIAGNQTLTDADATDLQRFFGEGVPGPNGTTITFDAWQKASVAAYGAFDTQIAINKQLNRGVKELTDQKERFLNQNLVRLNTIDDRAQYEIARETWLASVENAQGDPRAILEASTKYAETLGVIRGNAEKATGLEGNDPEFIGGILNEINALTTGTATGATVADLQSTSGEGVSTGDAESTAAGIASAIADADALANGTAFYGQEEHGGAFGVVPYPPGAALDPFGRMGLGQDTQPAIINVNGKPTQVMLKGKPIESQSLVDANGQPVSSIAGPNGQAIPIENLNPAQVQALIDAGQYQAGEKETVGYVFQQNGKTTFGVVTPEGIKFTDTNPFTGAFGLGEASYTIITGSTFDPEGNVRAAPPSLRLNLAGADSLLVDSTVQPNDIRDLAGNALTETQAQGYLALADKRQKSKQAEQDYMSRSVGKGRNTLLDNLVREGSGVVQNIVREAILGPDGVIADAAGILSPLLPPSLKPKSYSPPPGVTGPAPSPTVAPADLGFPDNATNIDLSPEPVSPETLENSAGDEVASISNKALERYLDKSGKGKGHLAF